jgi:hypothetical protein
MMFERMNNVQERTSVPQQKRRKMETEENRSTPASFGTGGGGILGQHLKDEREKAAKNAVQQRVDTVDLSRKSAAVAA